MTPESSPDAQYRSDLPAPLTHPVVPLLRYSQTFSQLRDMEDIMYSGVTP